MPPHLHPRSSATTTLFASTLAASFIIVGIPHVFPCPAPKKGYLDAEGNVVRRRRRRKDESDGGRAMHRMEGQKRQTGIDDASASLGGELKSLLGHAGVASSDRNENVTAAPAKKEAALRNEEEEEVKAMFRDMEEEAAGLERERRECPVPKPRGKIGELLGFGRDGMGRRVEEDR
jgi:cytochrome c oxidase assembly factor 2